MNRDEYIPISYLSQFYYCNRRAALLLIEQIWEENEYTAEGRMQHENVHTEKIERRGSVIKLHEMSVFSDEMRLIGKCDCIEAISNEGGSRLPFGAEKYSLFPIEYKHGKRRNEEEYNVQLCAQAICLEEMYGCKIEEGAIFYINDHKRDNILFTEELRKKVEIGAEQLYIILNSKVIPKPVYTKKCLKCSISDYCGPRIKTSAKRYCNNIKLEAIKEGD